MSLRILFAHPINSVWKNLIFLGRVVTFGLSDWEFPGGHMTNRITQELRFFSSF
jgi:hypothetical protein